MLLLLLFVALLASSTATASTAELPSPKCPGGCYCDEKRFPDVAGLPDGGLGLKINCHPLASGTMDFAGLPANTVQLDLAKYGLKEITEGMFATTPHLQKLDLQNNEIAHIDEAAFANLQLLEVLDLSRNKLEVVTSNMFEGLVRLDRLKLNDNRIQTIESSAFDHLAALSKLELSENPFICDCNLAWFLRWLDARSTLLANAPKTKCALPIELADSPLRKVNPEKLVCSSSTRDDDLVGAGGDRRPKAKLTPAVLSGPHNSGVFSLVPEHQQVAFEGDAFQLSCKVGRTSKNQKLQWLVRGKPLTRQPGDNVTVTSTNYDEENLMESAIFVHALKASHSGEWTCLLSHEQEEAADAAAAEKAVIPSSSEQHRSVNVLVITATTRLCHPMTTSTSKGTYVWGTAIGGHTVQQTCKKNREDRSFGFAFLLCRENGDWSANVNSSQCGYTNQVTDTLHKFATMNKTFTYSAQTLLSSAKYFLNFTDGHSVVKDEMDVVYYAQAVENYLPYLHRGGDLGRYVIGMVENLLGVDMHLMGQAQLTDHSCERLLHVVNNVTLILPAFQHHTNKMAVESYDIHQPVKFEGVTCTWYSSVTEGLGSTAYLRFSRRVFHCADTNKTLPSRGKVVLASVAVPRSLYQHINGVQRMDLVPASLVFAVYSNASFFPTTLPSPDFLSVETTVIGTNYYGKELGNLSERISVSIRSNSDAEVQDPSAIQPVWWDQGSNGGFGSWTPDYCSIGSVVAQTNIITFSCNRVGYYSYRLLKASSRGAGGRKSSSGEQQQPEFRLHHPLIYVGSVVSLVLILASIVVYCVSFSSIRISSPLKHALVNIWIALASLIFLFSTGIHQVEDVTTCRLVGIASHYLTLCNLIWIVISINIIFQKVNGTKQRQARAGAAFLQQRGGAAASAGHPGGTSSKSVLRPTITRFYLFGWGLGAIVCGVSGAINIKHYGLSHHCFMQLTPFLASVILPGALLTALMTGFALSAWCIVSSSPSHVAERFVDEGEAPLRCSSSQASVSSSPYPDQEKTVKSLLLAHAYIYVLFLSTWMCGSLAVVQPLEGNLLHEELIFAVLFSISAISLGVFIFVYFCASRQDVQECWRNPLCCDPRRGRLTNAAGGGFRSPTGDTMTIEETSNLVNLHPRQMGGDQFGTAGGGSHYGGINSAAGPGLPPFTEFGGGIADGFNYPDPNYAAAGGGGGSTGYGGGGINRNYSRIKEAANNKARKDSDGGSSEHLSLNNVNHLRRGYVAPVNSAGVSEAEYGLYAPPSSLLFGASSAKMNTNLNVHVDGSSYLAEKMPMTSSPAGGAPVPLSDQDITMSPLAQHPPPQNNDVSFDGGGGIHPGLDYTESSTIKMGAPCRLASFAALDFPSLLVGGGGSSSAVTSSNGAKLPPGFVKPNSGLSKRALHERQQRRRQYERYRTVPDICEQDNAERASDDQDDAQSKFSGVSSSYSSRSGRNRPNKKPKRPNRRRPRAAALANAATTTPTTEPLPNNHDHQIYRSLEERVNQKNRHKGRSLDDNYLGDDDHFDTLDRRNRNNLQDSSSSLREVEERADSEIVEGCGGGSSTSQFTAITKLSSCELPSRETSV